MGNSSTYDFPIRLKVINGLHDNPYPPIRDDEGNYTRNFELTLQAARELQDDGVRAVVMSCGFFSIAQEVLSEELDVPVYTSPLLLVPLISRLIGKKRKVGILTASKQRLTTEFLEPVGIDDSTPHVVGGLEPSTEFYACFMSGTRTTLNVDLLRKEVVDTAKDFVSDNPEVGLCCLNAAISHLLPLISRLRLACRCLIIFRL